MEPIPETKQVLDQLLYEGDPHLAASLLQMGRRAQEIVPECVGLSLGLLEEDLTLTLVASSAEIAFLDAVQYLDGGPCVEAAHDDRVVDVDIPQMVTEGDWQLYARASAAAGVAASLTLPILRAGTVVGSVNMYASAPDAFAGHHEELADALGVSARNAITNADLGFSTRLEAAQGPERLADQYDMDVALGLIAESHKVDITMARERLRQAAARAGITQGQAARALLGTFRPEP